MTDREISIMALRELYVKDRVLFTDRMDKELGLIKKKEDLESVLELFSELKKELVEISPFLSSTIQPVFLLLIKNHYYKQISENAELFEACANITVCRMMDELVANNKNIRFLTQVENYRLKRLTLTLAEKFKENDIAFRLELELQKEDMEWRDSVE
jgi:hypothetical protein